MKSFSFKVKLLLICMSMALVSIVIGGLSYNGLKKVKVSNDRVIDGVAPNLKLVNSMGQHYLRLRILIRTLGLPGLSQKEADQSIHDALEEIKQYDEDAKTYDSIPFVDGEKEIYEKVTANWIYFKATALKVIDLYKSGKPEDHAAMIKIFLVDCPAAAEKYTDSLNTLLEFHKKHFTEYSAESNEITNNTNITILVVTLIGICVSLLFGYFFADSLSKTFAKIAVNLEKNASALSSASSQIAKSSETLSQATTEQSSSLQETSSSLEEINSMINMTTENAKSSSLASSESLQNSEKGKKVVEDMIFAIKEIDVSNQQIMNQVQDNNQEMQEIIKVIEEIVVKTKVINDIVFQTKLLSFNASVEAARAGENGKGFAVVAEEVGNLAAMSGEAASEISKMLEKSSSRVSEIVKNSSDKIGVLVEKGKRNVDSGAKIATECGGVLDEIVRTVGTVHKSITEISSASQEQAQGVAEITKAIALLNQVTQENSNNSVESAIAAESLSRQAVELNELVHEMVVTVEGEKGQSTHTKPDLKTAHHGENSKITELKRKDNKMPVSLEVKRLEKKNNDQLPGREDSRFVDV